MSKNTQKILENRIFYLNNSYSHSLVVLPYDYQIENTPKRGRVSEDCLRQSLHIVERRLKIE